MSTSEYSPSTGTGSESSTPSVDASEVERAKREIQGLVQEIAELSRADVEPGAFYDALLNKVVAALAAPGGAVWTIAETGGLQLAYQINLRDTGLIDNPIGQSQHGRLLRQVMEGNEGALVAPQSGTGDASTNDPEAAANSTDFLLVLSPVHNDQGPQGVVEVFQRPGARVATQRGYLRFLQQICEFAGDFLKGRRLQHLAEKQSLWEQLETFTRTAHEKLDVRQAAYTIANEGRRLIGCDRVSVAILHGSRCRIEAVSGQDTFDKRSNVTVLLGELATAVTKTGEDVWYSGDTSDMAPQVEDALDAYVDESHTRSLAILPLFEPGGEVEVAPDEEPEKLPEVIGALIVEQMVDVRTAEGFRQRVDVVRSHSSTALTNALEYEGLFLMPVWRALGQTWRKMFGRARRKTLVISSIIATLFAVACFVPIDFKLEGQGNLRPKIRQNVYASLPGDVREIHVKDFSQVNQGDLLVELQSDDLDKELNSVRGQLDEASASYEATIHELRHDKNLSRSERSQKNAQRAQSKQEIIGLKAELDLLKKKKEKLQVRSPIDGRVVDWNLHEKLRGVPANQGDILMKIANPDGDWEVEVRMPESRMGHIAEAMTKSADGKLKVGFILATHPSEKLEGWVREIASSAEVRGEEGNTVLIRVDFDQETLRKTFPEPKIGGGVIANVYCGKRSIAYVYLHDMFDFVRKKILFRL